MDLKTMSLENCYKLLNPSDLADRQQYTMNLLVANKPGVLGRIALVFSRRGYNIEALSVSHTLDRKFSRIEITTEGHEELLDDIIKQTRNIIDVIHVNLSKLTPIEKPIISEHLFYRVSCSHSSKPILLGVIEDSSFSIVDFDDNSLIIQSTSNRDQNITYLELIRHYGDVEEISLNTTELRGDRS